MATWASQDLTGLLAAWGNGDEGALNSLMPMVYPELRRIARRHLARRYFGGLNVAEAAEVLGISPETAKRAGNLPKRGCYAN
jgi:hypothetical protein